MSEDKCRERQLDDFWDISSLVPAKKQINRRSGHISLTEIQHGGGESVDPQSQLTESGTLIKRFIPPHSADCLTDKPQPTLTYTPKNSLVHKVSLYKEISNYAFYESFCTAVRELWDRKGYPCDYADFFSDSPQ